MAPIAAAWSGVMPLAPSKPAAWPAALAASSPMPASIAACVARADPVSRLASTRSAGARVLRLAGEPSVGPQLLSSVCAALDEYVRLGRPGVPG